MAEEQSSVMTEGAESANVKSGKKVFVGVVKSNKMDKTIVVSVETTTLHRLYKKYIVRSKKLKAHDEKNEAKVGDRVRVVECRPISKEKCWRLDAILERAK